jgi:hypothetical protein
MDVGKLVCAEFNDFVPRYDFDACVTRRDRVETAVLAASPDKTPTIGAVSTQKSELSTTLLLRSHTS